MEDIKYVKVAAATQKVKRIDVRKTRPLHKIRLRQMIALCLKMEERYITIEMITDALTICQGKLWSEEFDNKSKCLAQEINDTFDRIAADEPL